MKSLFLVSLLVLASCCNAIVQPSDGDIIVCSDFSSKCGRNAVQGNVILQQHCSSDIVFYFVLFYFINIQFYSNKLESLLNYSNITGYVPTAVTCSLQSCLLVVQSYHTAPYFLIYNWSQNKSIINPNGMATFVAANHIPNQADGTVYFM